MLARMARTILANQGEPRFVVGQGGVVVAGSGFVASNGEMLIEKAALSPARCRGKRISFATQKAGIPQRAKTRESISKSAGGFSGGADAP